MIGSRQSLSLQMTSIIPLKRSQTPNIEDSPGIPISNTFTYPYKTTNALQTAYPTITADTDNEPSNKKPKPIPNYTPLIVTNSSNSDDIWACNIHDVTYNPSVEDCEDVSSIGSDSFCLVPPASVFCNRNAWNIQSNHAHHYQHYNTRKSTNLDTLAMPILWPSCHSRKIDYEYPTKHTDDVVPSSVNGEECIEEDTKHYRFQLLPRVKNYQPLECGEEAPTHPYEHVSNSKKQTRHKPTTHMLPPKTIYCSM